MPDALYASFFLLPSSAFLPFMPMARPSISESPRVLGKIQIWGFLLRATVYLMIGPSYLHFSEFSRWSLGDLKLKKHCSMPFVISLLPSGMSSLCLTSVIILVPSFYGIFHILSPIHGHLSNYYWKTVNSSGTGTTNQSSLYFPRCLVWCFAHRSPQ